MFAILSEIKVFVRSRLAVFKRSFQCLPFERFRGLRTAKRQCFFSNYTCIFRGESRIVNIGLVSQSPRDLLNTLWPKQHPEVWAPLRDNADPYIKVHGANMGPTWVLTTPDGPRVGPMNLAIRGVIWPILLHHRSILAGPNKVYFYTVSITFLKVFGSSRSMDPLNNSPLDRHISLKWAGSWFSAEVWTWDINSLWPSVNIWFSERCH